MFKGLNIRGAMSQDEKYLYAISDSIKDPISMVTFNDNEEDEEEKKNLASASGFYVYNTDQLFEGRIMKYKLMSTVGGQCSLIDNSKFADRISLI